MKIRPIEYDDMSALSDFRVRNRESPLTTQYWARRWAINKAMSFGDTPLPTGWVIEHEGGGIVGHLGCAALRYEFRGQSLQAAAASEWVVEPLFRMHSLQLLSKYFSQPSVDIFVNSYPTEVAVRAWKAFGGGPVPVPDCERLFFRIINYAAFGRCVWQKKSWPLSGIAGSVLGVVLGFMDSVRGRGWRSEEGEGGLECREAVEFAAQFDPFWDEMRAHPNLLRIVRDSKSLQLYFGDFLATGRGWVVVCEQNGKMVGYAVLVRKDNLDIGLCRILIADLQAIGPDRESVMQKLIKHVLLGCRKRNIAVVELVGFSARKRQAIAPLLPRSRIFPNPPFIYKTRNATLREMLKEPEVWDPCIMDGADAL